MLKQKFINETFKFVAILENTWDFIFSQVWLTVKTYSILYLISIWLNTSRDLLNGTYWSKPNMTKKLKFLEENRFITRETDKNDKRVFRFSMTPKASESIKKISPIYEESLRRLFIWIDEEKIECSYNVIEQALKNMMENPCCKR